MEPTALEKLMDEYIRHQTYLIRYSNGLSREAADLLATTESKLNELVLVYSDRLSGQPLRSRNAQEILKSFENAVRAARGIAWDEIDELINNQMVELAKEEAKYNIIAIDDALPVVLNLSVPSVTQVTQIALAQPFQGRVLGDWLARTKNFDAERIVRKTKTAILDGLTPTEVARSIVGTSRMRFRDGEARKAFRDMESVILTVTNGINNEVRSTVYEQNSDIIKMERFMATLDSRTTLTCMAAESKDVGLGPGIYRLGEGPKPPLHFRCRSLRVAIFRPEDLISRPFNPTTEKMIVKEFAKANNLKKVTSRADLPRGYKTKFDEFARKRKRELIGQTPGSTTYQQFLKKQSREFQDEVLGPTRAQLFRDGELTLDRFVARDGDVLTLDELRTRGVTINQ